MKLIIHNKIYNISDLIWEKHLAIHPVRPKDALLNNIDVVLDNTFSEADIEKLIIDEFNVHSNFGNIVAEARNMYKNGI